ncbi:hypothetical protein NA78x_005372 [Anatilimnocola sp. NA78]|uniref:hypothetical protein n=1 Tax=Anatilimnocola sp. NA78 TaxID=3415683 RepID=UPI003CE49A92
MSKILNVPDIAGMTERISSIRLSGGVVGRLSTVLICATVALGTTAATVAFSGSEIGAYVAGGIAVLLALLILCVCGGMVWFAHANPQAALFEGAEFLLHEQMTLGMKGAPNLSPQSQQSELAVVLLPPADGANAPKDGGE